MALRGIPQSGLTATALNLHLSIFTLLHPRLFLSFLPTLTQLPAGECPTLARKEKGTGRLLERIPSTPSAEASPSPGRLKEHLAVAILLPATRGQFLGLLILMNPLQRLVVWQLLLHLIGLNLNIGFLLLTPG